MVDEFENELPTSVGERVRASVAELCGALDDLIDDDDDDTSPSQNQNPSLREQLVDSWQGKSYYERLEGMVNGEKKPTEASTSNKTKQGRTLMTKTKPLSSINLNSVNNNSGANKKSSYALDDDPRCF